jgi:hypothetical protein
MKGQAIPMLIGALLTLIILAFTIGMWGTVVGTAINQTAISMPNDNITPMLFQLVPVILAIGVPLSIYLWLSKPTA